MEEEPREQEITLQSEAVTITQGGAVNSVNGQTGDVVLTTSDLENTSDYQTGSEVESAISTAVAGEASARESADTTLQNNIDTVAGNLQTEITNRQSADASLQGAISAEATAREAADTNLQSQIDGITASSDVTDIVGTYAQLQAYDTSTLGDNDIIKVLQDESRNNETTYYRWSTATQSFTLIGEEGPYYTKSQTDTLLNAKQNTLTAGANIQINNNTISAADTTYTDFTGTDGTADGANGLVPAPATTDAGKFLKADGTWDDAGGGGGGGVIELTTDDYNAPASNPTAVALASLEPGVYTWKGNVNVRVGYRNNDLLYYEGRTAIVGYGNPMNSSSTVKFVLLTGALNATKTNPSFIKFYTIPDDGTYGNEISSVLTTYNCINDLTTTSRYVPLSANQGKVLNDKITALEARVAALEGN